MLNYLHKSNNVEVHESVLHIIGVGIKWKLGGLSPLFLPHCTSLLIIELNWLHHTQQKICLNYTL